MSPFLMLLVVAANGGQVSDPQQQQCEARRVVLEQKLLRHKLDRRSLDIFSRVATARKRANEEVIPGLLGCPDLHALASELLRNSSTRQLLASEIFGAQDYIVTGWSILLARDPAAFGLNNHHKFNSALKANQNFLRQHRAKIDRLLFTESD